MTYHLLTIFPDIFNSYLNEGILKRAQDKKIVSYQVHDLRAWTKDKHRTIDDAPYGGGAGMLMKIEPLYQALEDIKKKSRKKPAQRRIILLSASGKKWNQKMAVQHTKFEEIILICGRYEGVDARLKKFIDEEISIGDYVLTGGELPALTLIDSITRLLPGVLGNKNSLSEESHASPGQTEYPQYTRPEVFVAQEKKYRVPKILLSGDHKKIAAWRNKKMSAGKKQL